MVLWGQPLDRIDRSAVDYVTRGFKYPCEVTVLLKRGGAGT